MLGHVFGRPNADCSPASVHPMLDITNGNEPRPTGRRSSLSDVCGSTVPSQEEGGGLVPDARAGGKKKRRGPQKRFWCFTSNTAKDRKFLQTIEGGLESLGGTVRYIVFQEERAATGKVHYQGYVEFSKSYRLNQVRAIIDGSGHYEPRRGTSAEAIAYCKKEDTRISGPWEFGKASKGAGTRTDLEGFKEQIKGGSRKKDLYDESPLLMAKYPKFYADYRLTLQGEDWRKVECVLLIGDTGTGKTRWVYDNWKGFWRLPLIITALWFDTYDGEKHVLIDDFTGASSKVSLAATLMILDGYFIKVPIKYGFTWWGPSHIAVTTNIEPKYWYKWKNREHQYMALARRFSLVMHFTGEDGVINYSSDEYFHADDINFE